MSRLRGMTAAVAVAGLLGLVAACGSSQDEATTSGAGPTAAAATKAAPAKKADTGVSGTDMKAGCEAVHKLFAALDAGDTAAAQSLKKKGDDIFNDIAATEATKDIQLATDAAAMASVLEFKLPEQPIYQSGLAETYGVDCVARYGAAALPA
jgi:hypothetical protein